MPETLLDLRGRIDALDEALLRLLNDRARLVQAVGEAKRGAGQAGAFYVPEREHAIHARLAGLNEGPFPTPALRPVFQEILSACLSLEKGLRVAYLGPEATFTHAAARQQFGLSADLLPEGTVASVFQQVERGRADAGVVPLENSTEGMVGSTLDTLLDSDLSISAEIVLAVEQCLLLRPGLDPSCVRRVYSHPHALGQCRAWLAAHLPGAEPIHCASTADAARMAKGDGAGAALASELAAPLYGLVAARQGIQDQRANFTRFLVVGRHRPRATGRERTTLLLRTPDGPGALLNLLRPLAEAGLNLSRIESHPTRKKAWDYAFFLDVDGHREDAPLAEAIAGLSARCDCRVLGSYPRVTLRDSSSQAS
jgi:chorismate mutase/prephenate dehydratase